MSSVTLTLKAARDLAHAVLAAHRTSPANAGSVAKALVAAEADGQPGHGLSRLPAYAGQAASGKVDGFAVPRVEPAGRAAVRIDASHGFAYPALDLAVAELSRLAPDSGIAAAAIHRSHHCGMAGLPVEHLARAGLAALLFANSPKAMAPWGGTAALYGTNPIAFAAPRDGAEPLVIDLSLSKVARGKVMLAAREGRPIPEDWALDAEGHPTTDPDAALAGSMLPMGEAKGAALALAVEILAAGLTGACLGFEAGSFFTAEGEPPGVGQLLIAFAPGPLSGGTFAERLETLLDAVEAQDGTRLPGTRRSVTRAQARETGVAISQDLHAQLLGLANS